LHLPAHHYQHSTVPCLQKPARPASRSRLLCCSPPRNHHRRPRHSHATSPFHLAKVTLITEALLSLHYLGTTTPNLDSAVFRLLWLAPDSRTVLKDSCPARNHTAITGEIDTDDLNDLLVASHLTLTSTGRLTRKYARLLPSPRPTSRLLSLPLSCSRLPHLDFLFFSPPPHFVFLSSLSKNTISFSSDLFGLKTSPIGPQIFSSLPKFVIRHICPSHDFLSSNGFGGMLLQYPYSTLTWHSTLPLLYSSTNTLVKPLYDERHQPESK
jgi:hypothetical protein